MRLTGKILILLMLLTTGIPAFSYWSTGHRTVALIISAVGIVWLVSQKTRWRWVGTTCLIFFIIAAVRGIFSDIPGIRLLLGVVLALCSWDLDEFKERVINSGRVEKIKEIEFDHLVRLFFVAIVGLLLGSVALFVEIKLSFGWMLFLSAVGVLGLSRLFSILGR